MICLFFAGGWHSRVLLLWTGVMHALKSDLARYPGTAQICTLSRPSLGTAWMAQILSRTAQCTKHNAINGKRIYIVVQCLHEICVGISQGLRQLSGG